MEAGSGQGQGGVPPGQHGTQPQQGGTQPQQGGTQPQQGGTQTQQAAAGAAAPGWYPDPQGTGGQRWWDGTTWTEHVQPPAAQADPAWLAAKADSDARQWAMFAHLSALIGLITSLPWLGPLIIYLVKKNDHPFVAEQAREALNFNISVFIYMLVTVVAAVVLAIVLVGFLLIPVAIGIGIAWLVFVIIAAVKANAGEAYRYPLTIRMVS